MNTDSFNQLPTRRRELIARNRGPKGGVVNREQVDHELLVRQLRYEINTLYREIARLLEENARMEQAEKDRDDLLGAVQFLLGLVPSPGEMRGGSPTNAQGIESCHKLVKEFLASHKEES